MCTSNFDVSGDASVTLDGTTDDDFQAFIAELGRPASVRSLGSSEGECPKWLPTVSPNSSMIEQVHVTSKRLPQLQGLGLRSIPVSINRQMRKYRSTGSKVSLQQSHKLASGTEEEAPPRISTPRIPASPKLQIQTTPMKRSSMAGLACTLMPFSLIKAYPGQDNMSLADVNCRIQSFADFDPSRGSSSKPKLRASPPHKHSLREK